MPHAHQPQEGRHRRPFVAPAAVVGLGALAALGDMGSEARAESHKLIGAFAHSNETGAWGYGVNFRNSEDASRRAIAECQARAGSATDCVMVKAFGHLCAALAEFELPGTTTDGKPKIFRFHYVGTSSYRRNAEAAGLNECRSNVSSEALKSRCRVLKVACSDDRN